MRRAKTSGKGTAQDRQSLLAATRAVGRAMDRVRRAAPEGRRGALAGLRRSVAESRELRRAIGHPAPGKAPRSRRSRP